MPERRIPASSTRRCASLAADAGILAEDAGILAADASILAEDAGILAADASILAEDASILAADASILAEDAGILAADAGILAADAGILAEDAGILAEDAGILAADAGILAADAGILAADTGILAEDASVLDVIMPVLDIIVADRCAIPGFRRQRTYSPRPDVTRVVRLPLHERGSKVRELPAVVPERQALVAAEVDRGARLRGPVFRLEAHGAVLPDAVCSRDGLAVHANPIRAVVRERRFGGHGAEHVPLEVPGGQRLGHFPNARSMLPKSTLEHDIPPTGAQELEPDRFEVLEIAGRADLRDEETRSG